jgi:hypothetical protein
MGGGTVQQLRELADIDTDIREYLAYWEEFGRKETVHIIERKVEGSVVYAAIVPRISVGLEGAIELSFKKTPFGTTVGGDNTITVYGGDISETYVMESSVELPQRRMTLPKKS